MITQDFFWVYLVNEKNEVEQVFKSFHRHNLSQIFGYLEVIMERSILTWILGNFFLENGIIRQSSCVDTPQHNSIAKRKNKHLLEVTRSLLFSTKVLKYLWGETILTIAYLLNKMPSKILKFQTLLQVLKNSFPTT